MSSIGNRGARSAGPIGCPVPGCRTAGGGDLRSAAMLYQRVGMSFSDRMNFVWDLSATAGLLRGKWGHRTGRRAIKSTTAPSLVRAPELWRIHQIAIRAGAVRMSRFLDVFVGRGAWQVCCSLLAVMRGQPTRF